MEEVWKDIYFYNKITDELIDYRGLYQVSNLGRLRSLDKYVRGYNHGVEHRKLIHGRVLKCRLNKGGYPLAHLAREGKHRDFSLHRLVYFTFNPEADTTLTVNHKDEDKTNNALSNLELITQLENNRYGTRGERVSKGVSAARKRKYWTSHPWSKREKRHILQYSLNGEFIREYNSALEAKIDNNMKDKSCIYEVCNGKRKTAGGYIWKFKKDCV